MGWIEWVFFGIICAAVAATADVIIRAAKDMRQIKIWEEDPEAPGSDRCVCCGKAVPEWRLICPECERKDGGD